MTTITDPKEVELTDSNSSCPRTKQALIDWFTGEGEKPSPELLTIIEHGDYEDYPTLWNQILDRSMSSDFHNNAWVARSGRVWTCGWANHERMLGIMGLRTSEIERAGWMRVSGMSYPTSIQILKQPSPQQLHFIKKHGLKTIADRQIRIGLPPLPADAPVFKEFE